MLSTHSLATALAALAAAATPAAPAPSAVAIGEIRMDEAFWRAGSRPSLTFTLATGRGTPQKVAAFLYTSEEPDAFHTATFPPQFVGSFYLPASVSVLVDRPPERGPIVEASRERFVQGALFDLRTGALLDVTNEAYIDIVYQAPPTVYELDFETEDDFSTPLVNGQDLSTPPEFGELVSVSSLQPDSGAQHKGLAIFDTDASGPNAQSTDPDLLVNLGNAVILQENAGQSVPGIFTFPDDSANGGRIVFEFSGFDFIEKVEPRSIDLIDVDGTGGGVKVFLADVLGRKRAYTAPSGWTEDIAANGGTGYRTLDLTTLVPQPGFASTATVSGPAEFLQGEIVRIEIAIVGSGAVDNLVFAKESDPSSPVVVGGHPLGVPPDGVRKR